MHLYKYEIKHWEFMISVGDNVKIGKEVVKIITIIRIDIKEMIVYFCGVPVIEIGDSVSDDF